MRVREVARWPAWELDLVEQYLAREPVAEDRIDEALARFMAIYVKVHSREGSAPPKVEDFLPYHKAWPEPASGRYSELDQEVLREVLGTK